MKPMLQKKRMFQPLILAQPTSPKLHPKIHATFPTLPAKAIPIGISLFFFIMGALLIAKLFHGF